MTQYNTSYKQGVKVITTKLQCRSGWRMILLPKLILPEELTFFLSYWVVVFKAVWANTLYNKLLHTNYQYLEARCYYFWGATCNWGLHITKADIYLKTAFN